MREHDMLHLIKSKLQRFAGNIQARRESVMAAKRQAAQLEPAQEQAPATTINYAETLGRINTVLDIFLKAGAMGIVFGAFIVRQYLIDIGFANLFTSVISSVNGLLAVAVGFGLVAVLLWILLTIKPWMLWQIRKHLKTENAERLFSFKYIFTLIFLVQAVFITLVIGNVSTSWFLLSIILPFIPMWLSPQHELSLIKQGIYTGWIWLSLVFSIMPLLLVIPMLEYKFTQSISVFSKDGIQITVAFVWSLLYAFIATAAVRGTKISHEKSEAIIFLSTGAIFFVMLFGFLQLVPGFFVQKAMSTALIRQTPHAATWWYVQDEAYQRLVTDPAAQTTIIFNKKTYLCAYSPLLSSERVVLCPATEKQPNSQNCYAFLGTEVMPLTKQKIAGASCSAPIED
jgi:hypothetical protein